MCVYINRVYIKVQPLPLLISKDFSPSKKRLILRFFFLFRNFRKLGSILRVFLPQKWLILQFSRKFCEMGPSSKYVFDHILTHV